MTEHILTLCPYCNDEWIEEDIDLLCTDCNSKMELDFIIIDIINGINCLEKKYTFHDIKNRLTIIKNAKNILNKIIIGIENI